MSNFQSGDDRQAIPRWHLSDNARIFSQEPSNKIRLKNTEHNEESVREWKACKSLDTATDLIVRYELFKDFPIDVTIEASKFILDSADQAKYLQLSAARKILGINQNQDVIKANNPPRKEIFGHKIGQLRALCREFPRDAFIWSDIGFCYAVLGRDDDAKKCLTVAINLAPNSALVVRAYARFLVHLGEYEEALQRIQRLHGLRTDPLILSVDIAIRERFKLGGIQVREARKFVGDESFHPARLSELRSALGTLEFNSGRSHRAKKLINESLKCASENAVTQAIWLRDSKDFSLDFDIESLSPEAEAQAIEYYFAENYDLSVNSLIAFYAYQPFSDSPLVDATYIRTFCQNDPKGALKLGKEFSIDKTNSFSVRNNLTVAAILTNDITLAEEFLAQVFPSELSGTETNIHLATTGLFAFKIGAPEQGRALYDRAIDYFKTNKNRNAQARALYYYALAELDYDKKRSLVLASQSQRISNAIGYRQMDAKLDKIIAECSK